MTGRAAALALDRALHRDLLSAVRDRHHQGKSRFPALTANEEISSTVGLGHERVAVRVGHRDARALHRLVGCDRGINGPRGDESALIAAVVTDRARLPRTMQWALRHPLLLAPESRLAI